MKKAKLLSLPILSFLVQATVTLLSAQEAPPSLHSRSWRVPPAMILSDTPPPAMEAEQVLKAVGVTFPPGSSAIFYTALDIVTVRNTPANLELAGAYIASIWPEPQPQLSMTVYLVRAPEEVLRSLESGSPRNQHAHLQKLLKDADGTESESRVQILHTLHTDATNGRRCRVESAASHEHTARMTLPSEGKAAVESEVRSLGFSVEFDPLVLPEKEEVNLTIAVEWSARNDVPRQETLVDPVSGASMETPVPEFAQQKAAVSTAIPAGQARLIAIWPVDTEFVSAGRKFAHAVIVTPHLIRSSKADPNSYALPDVGKDFQAMVERTFDVPEELFDRNASTDPNDLEKFLPNNGINLPEDSEVRLDQKRRLVVKTHADVMPIVALWVDRFWQRMTGSINVGVEVLEAPSERVRSLLRECAGTRDQRSAIEKLQNEIGRGGIRSVALTHVETRSGHRTQVKSCWDRGVLSDLEWHRQPHPAFRTEQRNSGLILRFDPAISVGYNNIHAELTLQYDYASPSHRQEKMAEPVGKRSFLLPRDEFHRAVAEVSVLLPDGAPRVLAAWRPLGERGTFSEDVMQVAVITGRILKWPKAERTDQKEPPPTRPVRSTNAEEMQVRSFALTPRISVPESASNPFFSSADEPRNNRASAKQILEGQGIPFPAGSSVTVVPATSKLLVRNTEANLALVAAYVKRVNFDALPDIALTLNVIEAPASLAKEILADAVDLPDHTKVLQQLLSREGTAKVRSVVLLKGTDQAGQRAEVAQTKDHRLVREVWIDKDGDTEVEYDCQRIGTAFEFDTAVRYRNTFIEVDCRFRHHLAPPILRRENLASSGESPIEIPLSDFFAEDVECVVHLRSGTTRIMAIWKPRVPDEHGQKDGYHIAFLHAAASQVDGK